MKSVKTALNARVVIFGKAQTDEDGIIRCAITISNFSMWDNAAQYSYRELYASECSIPTRNRSSLVETFQRTSVTTYLDVANHYYDKSCAQLWSGSWSNWYLSSSDPAKPVGETSENTKVRIN